jgi:hypothetical protein
MSGAGEVSDARPSVVLRSSTTRTVLMTSELRTSVANRHQRAHFCIGRRDSLRSYGDRKRLLTGITGFFFDIGKMSRLPVKKSLLRLWACRLAILFLNVTNSEFGRSNAV